MLRPAAHAPGGSARLGRRLPRVIVGMLLVSCLTGRAAATEEPIRTVEEYWADGVRETLRAVRMEMTVLYYDPAWGNLWCEIDGRPGYVRCQQPPLDLRAHDRVLIEGTVVPNEGFHRDLVKITVLASDPPPVIDARDRLRDFAALRGRIVSLEGIVDRQTLTEPDHFILVVAAEGVRVHVYHWTPDPTAMELPDGAIVRLTGVYNPKHDTQTESLEVDLWVARSQDFEILGNLATEPRFNGPLVTIEELSPFITARSDLARVAGMVHAARPGRITIRDHTGQMVVQTLQRLQLQVGDVIEAVGMRFTGGAEWLLRDAIVRRAAPELAGQVRDRLAEPPAQLRLAEQILELSPEEAADHRPVELIGVVMRPLVNSGFIFLRDTSGCVRVDVSEIDSVSLKDGTGIRLRGHTISGSFSPEVRGRTIEHWGTALLPVPKIISLEQAMLGSEQGERVEMHGSVTRLDADPIWTRLTLSTATGEFTAVLANEYDYAWLLGSVVTVRGVCQVVANARRQLTGIELWLSSGDDIQVEQAALSDPFTAPKRRIGSLRQFNRSSTINYWARVQGVLTHHVPGRFLFLQEDGSGIMVLTRRTDLLQPGDLVEATGVPGFENRRIVLRDAVYRKIGDGLALAPTPLPEVRDIAEDLEDALVHVTGRLINLGAEQGEVQLLLESDDVAFGVRLRSADDTLLQRWPVGSRLALTGVYEILRDERRQPQAFRLQLRSVEDVEVLEFPPWWTPQRTLLALGGLAACTLVGLGWVTSLRRRVRRQTLQLRDQFAREARLEARHHDIFDKASDFIFTTDVSGRVTSFNPAGERITGYTRPEALKLNVRDLIAPEDTEAGLLPALQRPADISVTFQSRLRTRDGRHIWTEINARLVHEDGEFTGLLAVVRDISERKQVEEELKRARDAAESTTHAKSAFLANMSHEIRTPMNGVIGMSNLLLDTPLSVEQRSFAETIRNSGEALLTVLNDILDFSKMEAGKLHLETVDFDFVDLVEDVIELVAERAAAKRLALNAILPSELPSRLRGDPGRLRQVLLNLLGNALKFTDAGRVTLRVQIEGASTEQLALRVEVIDSGIGIPPAELPQLFRPFVQADTSATRRHGGTGLGLAISRQIVELMGGSIGVECPPGGGSAFWFKVYLDRSPTGGDGSYTRAPFATLGRVLIVEHHQDTRTAVEQAVSALGFPVSWAASGEEAVARLTEAREGSSPSLALIIDSDLPDVEALRFRSYLHDRGLGEVPLILLRPIDQRLSPEDLAESGFITSVKKPVRRLELRRALALAFGTAGEEPATAPIQPKSRRPLPPLRILVAEDNPVNQRVIALQLQKLGYQAQLAANGQETLEALGRADYDLVLMDCQMPEMDGYEATRRIRANPRTSQVRIVAMTANAMRGDRERCLAVGMNDYISKPVRMDALEAVLKASATAGDGIVVENRPPV
jgi:PAS domain S-box-containing protein